MIRSPRILAGAAVALVLVAGAAGARQYRNNGATTDSLGVVPEVGDRAVDDSNPMPVRLPSGVPVPTTPATPTVASAIVALPQGTATQLSNPGLKRFAVQVQGAGRVMIGFDNAVCTLGYRLDGSPTATGQGPMQTWYPANSAAYWGCAPDAASVVFVERGQ